MAEVVSATEASVHFLNSLDPDKAHDERSAIERFVAWFGGGRPMRELTGDDVGAYAEQQGGGNGTALEPIRAFLAYSSRMAFTDENLVAHLHLGGEGGEGGGGEGSGAAMGAEGYHMTIEGVAALERDLEGLKSRRPEIAESLRTAMQDKDFRENAPLDAARDEQAHLEAHIREIEDQLRRAVIIDEDAKAGRADVGSTVKVLNLESSREQTFHLVSPAEVDPTSGKISVQSPFGAAIIDHGPGDEVTVHAPAGTLKLRLLEVSG